MCACQKTLFGMAVAWLALAIGNGCAHPLDMARGIRWMEEDACLKVVLEAQTWGDPGHPGVVGWLAMTNVSGRSLTVYDDPDLPSTLYTPSGLAEVYYALRDFPWEHHGGYPDSFTVRALQPGETYRLPFVLSNPLEQKTRYNPAYDDPASPLYRKWPACSHQLWKRCRVAVGYFPFEVPRQGSPHTISADGRARVGGIEYSTIAAQKEVTLSGKVGTEESPAQ